MHRYFLHGYFVIKDNISRHWVNEEKYKSKAKIKFKNVVKYLMNVSF